MAPAPFKVKAVFEYTSNHEDDLPFQIGQIITVTDEEDAEWYGGEYVDDAGVMRDGIFPRNFVEKYEPTAPPRPIRARKREAEPAPVAPPSPPPAAVAPPEQVVEEAPIEPTPEDLHEEIPTATLQTPPAEESRPAEASEASEAPEAPEAPEVPEAAVAPFVSVANPPEIASVPVANPPEVASVPAPAPIETRDVDPVGSSGVDAPPPPKSPSPVQSRSPPPIQPRSPPPGQRSPPPVLQKPSSNSFRDRIAAFNKPAAPPIAPFKPSGLGSGSSGFIKKPFVAPPPSRHAYVPPPRDASATRIYRREKEPETKEERPESADTAEKVGATPAADSEPHDEDEPKPTTLKERIALLQKQQADAAQRLADAVGKKEKPARPPKKRLVSNGAQETATTDQASAPSPSLERKDSADVTKKDSMDEPLSATQPLNTHHTPTGPNENDGVEAEKPGVVDTREGQEVPTLHNDNDEAAEKPLSPEGAAPEEQAAGDAEDEDDIDPEVRRREELRARMAKMSGGMGMAGMFGPPSMVGFGGGLPVKKPKPPIPGERRHSGISERPSSPRAPPVPIMMALPGMGKPKYQEDDPAPEMKQEPSEDEPTLAPAGDEISPEPESTSHISMAAPPVPGGRPAPPSIPTDTRPPPPPPPAAMASPSVGSESDDEMSENTSKPLEISKVEASPTTRGPPPPLPTSPRFSNDNHNPYQEEELPPVSPSVSSQQGKRNSRPPPPIPGVAPPAPTQTRPPPPLPPTAALSRASTTDELTGASMKPGRLDNGEEEEITEYEGDYDTDITPSTHHKDALGAHAGESSFDEDEGSARSPAAGFPSASPPPVPSSSAPRAGPPPIPTPLAPSFKTSVDFPRAGPPPIPGQPAPRPRASVDSPRAAPPPPPPKPAPYSYDDDDYDPYNYNAVQSPPVPSHSTPVDEEVEEYAPYQAPAPPVPLPATDRRVPPVTPTGSRIPLRKSADILRPSVARRSIDANRHSISMEAGFMASEIDLSSHTQWWLSRPGVPPVFQGRKDIYTESNETKSTEDGRKLVTKEVSILFLDYSQTIITIRYDHKDSSQAQLDQRHEPPPRPLRQDELEEAYERFGRRLAHSVASKKDSVVGDGTPHALVHDLLRPLKDALLPVGTRAYGALVYANLANAATQLNDEIRPGDIISIRNAKFQGKHGPMHAKYAMEVGKPDHVAIVAEWDGTKKKVRAWEQGRGGRKVKQESYKLEDLRSGEVKIWRVMPRTWIGWGLKD